MAFCHTSPRAHSRTHPCTHTHARVHTPRGFGEREWKSLQNLHQSEKKNSPRDIGRFGMGSRSYFHYADTVLVISNGDYIGLDPLQTMKSAEREDTEGWWHDVSNPEPPELAREVKELFDGLTLSSAENKFATFRLPLRRVENGFGAPIDRKGAEKLLSDWADSLQDGRLLLFLSSVERVSIRRWMDGQPIPTVVAEVNKRRGADTQPFPRLPSQLPETATATFAELQAYVLPAML